LVKKFVAAEPLWHVSRDSTAVPAREKPAKKAAPVAAPVSAAPAAAETQPKKRGRPRKGEVRPPKEPTRVQRQYAAPGSETDALLQELPTACDVGAKRNSKGHTEHWVGYKLHLDVGDTGVPLFALTTSASMHDSQAAIPMSRKTSERVTYFYELMDSAYDTKEIHQNARDLGHVPIIDPHARRGAPPPPLEPDRLRRFANRTTVERTIGWLKDNWGGRSVRVRGVTKVHQHLMFGVLVVFARVVLGWARQAT
jgi:hypothetical protein